jgi:hypothetical protein
MGKRSHSFGMAQGRVGRDLRLGLALPERHCSVGGGMPRGRNASFGQSSYFVYRIASLGAMLRENSWRCDIREISTSCLTLFYCSCAMTGQSSACNNGRPMKNENLKSTTVHFTESDLHLINALQEKLGLGMIHVIRLAIRRMAETESLLPIPPAPKKS